MSEFNHLDRISLVIVVAGALNLGLLGLERLAETSLEPIGVVASEIPPVGTALYLLIGIAGLYQAYFGYRLYSD